MKIAVFVSGGGHLDEALSVLKAFQGQDLILVTYEQKSLNHFQHPDFRKTYFLRLFSSWGPLLYLSLFCHLFECFQIFMKEKPDVIFSTGSEIAVVPFYSGKILFRMKTVFLETVTRFQMPSKTARWVYPVSDLFLVQWEELLKYFGPKAKCAGRIL